MRISISHINHWYENRIYQPTATAYYAQSGFYNFGYWRDDTSSQKEACENLMDRLLDFIPEKKGTILDVACGRGATTRHILRHYPPADVKGIDVSLRQLRTCTQNTPGAGFALMDASELAFEDRGFENVICVEAVFHFDTREEFLQEAFRVLRPGGRLVLTDILLTRWGEQGRDIRTVRNYVRDLEEYRNLYLRSGFEDVEIIDATYESWTRFYRESLRWQWKAVRQSLIPMRVFVLSYLRLHVAVLAMRYYLLVSAKKP